MNLEAENSIKYQKLFGFSEILQFVTPSLELALKELGSLISLEDNKNTFFRMLTAIKKENQRKVKRIPLALENLNSIFIAEPNSTTSVVAKLLGQIIKELSLLENGQLNEIDSSIFYGLTKTDSYLIVDKIFIESEGKIILVNDSIKTLQAKDNFSDSLLQYFLKKLYLKQDKVVAVLHGSRDEIEELLITVPVIQNQFPNIFSFEAYSNQ